MKTVVVSVVLVAAAFLTGVIVMLGLMAPAADADGKIRLVLDKTELYKDQRKITYTIVNDSRHIISFGAPYDIQINRNGEWVSAEWMKDRVWIMILYTLEPGKSFSAVAELPDDVELGRYRLVKKVMVEGTGEEIFLTAEFTVLQ